MSLTYESIQEAHHEIRSRIYHSPCVRSEFLSTSLGCDVYLKLEHLQMTGSFKERGALNHLRMLNPAVIKRGVVAASAGNHAQGVAYHANRLGSQGVIVMPEATPLTKVVSTRRFGARVILHGANYDEAYQEAMRICEDEGLPFVHPFDDYSIMAGQGTIALEILDDGIEPDAILVPIGGGGLIAGISTVIKERHPSCKVIGVQTERVPSMKQALDSGELSTIASTPTLADGIAVKRPGELTFPIVQRNVDDIVLVDEEEIASAILTLLETEKCLVEGAGAVPLAALTFRNLGLEGKRVVLVLCGGNIDMTMLSRIIERGLIKDGRMAKLQIKLQDAPGQLAIVSECIAKLRANVLEVYHNRSFGGGTLGQTFLDVTIETRGTEHVHEIIAALQNLGYGVEAI